jgi:hypothetical protein
MKAATALITVSFTFAALAHAQKQSRPKTRDAIQALYGSHFSGRIGPILRQARRIDGEGARMGFFGTSNAAGPNSRSRSGTIHGIKLGHTPETLTIAPDQKQSQQWYVHRGPSSLDLVHRHNFVAGKRTSKLLRRAGARTKQGEVVSIETRLSLEGGGVNRKAWLPGVKSVDLPVPGWARRMAKKLPRVEPASAK